MDLKTDEAFLGTLLLELNIITETQLHEALDRQENTSIEQLLGSILVREGFCSVDDVILALKVQQSIRGGDSKDSKRLKALAFIDFAISCKKSNYARDTAVRRGKILDKCQDDLRVSKSTG